MWAVAAVGAVVAAIVWGVSSVESNSTTAANSITGVIVVGGAVFFAGKLVKAW